LEAPTAPLTTFVDEAARAEAVQLLKVKSENLGTSAASFFFWGKFRQKLGMSSRKKTNLCKEKSYSTIDSRTLGNPLHKKCFKRKPSLFFLECVKGDVPDRGFYAL